MQDQDQDLETDEMDETDETEDSEPTKKKPPLVKMLLTKWTGLPSAKEQKRLKNELVRALRDQQEANELLQSAKERLAVKSRECVEAFGPHPLEIDGELHDPMSRGDRVYYRKRRASAEYQAI